MGKRNLIAVKGAKDPKGTLKRVIEMLGAYKIGVSLVLLLGVLASATQVVSPFILGSITDTLIESIKTNLNISLIIRLITYLLISYAIAAIFNYVQQLLLVNITQKFIYDLRKKVQHKFRNLPLMYLDGKSTGDTLSIVTNDVDTVASGLQNSMPNLLSSLLTVVIVFVSLLRLSPKLTLVGLITLPISALCSILMVKGSQKFFRGQQEGIGKIGGFVEEMFTGHEVIKAYNQEDSVISSFEELNQELYKNSRMAQFVSGFSFPLSAFFSNLGYVVVVVFGGILVATSSGTITIGNLQTFIQLLKQFTQPIAQLSSMLNDLQSMLASAERVFEFLDEEQEADDPKPSQLIINPQGSVYFDHIQFGYSEDNVLIQDLTLKVNSGDRVAIVGPTGAGKTTLVNLLLRFYDVSKGHILIDGIDIKNMKREDLRNLFGMVLQDTWLFNGTIMENIRYGRLGATDDEVIEAAKNAYVHDFVTTLPEGYNMIIDEDASNISNGQKQLITIARAILKNPKILILDEATSSVDTRTELMIQKAMENLMGGRTSFVIAHRLSTIRDSKTILVLNHGDIIETGSHDELLEKNGFYAELYRSQIAGNDDEKL